MLEGLKLPKSSQKESLNTVGINLGVLLLENFLGTWSVVSWELLALSLGLYFFPSDYLLKPSTLSLTILS